MTERVRESGLTEQPAPVEIAALMAEMGVKVEEMGYEYEPHSWRRKLCFDIGKDLQLKAADIAAGVPQ